MKIKYTLKPYIPPVLITEDNISEGDYIICVEELIEPAGLLKGLRKFTQNRRYKVNKICISNKTSKDSYFQITSNFCKRTKIKFRRNKNFMK